MTLIHLFVVLKQKEEKYEIEKAKHIEHLQTEQPLWESKYPKETPVEVPEYPKRGIIKLFVDIHLFIYLNINLICYFGS